MMNERKEIDARVVIVMALLCAVWGFQQVAMKAVALDMAPVLQAAVRSGGAAVVVGMLVVVRREGHALYEIPRVPALAVGLCFALEFLLVGEGLRFTSAAHMSIFLYTAPVFIALGLHLRLPEERLGSRQWIGIGLAFLGIVVSFVGRGTGMPSGSGNQEWIGDLCGIGAGVSWALTTLIIRFSPRLASAPATVMLLCQLAGAFVLLLIAAGLTGQMKVTVTPLLVSSLVFQTFIVSILTLLVWFSLLRVYLASRLGALSFMTPLFGVMASVVVLHEVLDRSFLEGGALVMVGIVLVNGRMRRKGQSVAASPKAVPFPENASCPLEPPV
ncbi:DMT family transporter [Acetobacter estunensis]|uniref:DMT family transporter n=1 Tax=Acetobacter estunensis TaxID=104097 RepID=UPI001C2DE2F2|nr:DMT family transporter [Acetobacter estunensis]MBV1838445.1 DMT family transporter [Acetobacter estunensis]